MVAGIEGSFPQAEIRSKDSLMALPPAAQQAREIEAILRSGEIPSGDVIESITKTDTGYLIKTNHRDIEAIVHYGTPKMPGPIPFTIEYKAL